MNEGLKVHDLQKKLWVLRRSKDIVSVLLIVLCIISINIVLFLLALHYVLLSLDQ